MTISVTYNSDVRDTGTAVLCVDALRRGLGFGEECRRHTPQGMIPPHELNIYVDDGRDEITWETPRPNAYWAIDTHLGWDYRLWKAKHFDHVFCAQKSAAEKMRAEGIKAEWLPLACSPCLTLGDQGAHPDVQELLAYDRTALESLLWGEGLEKVYDLVFCGYLNDDSAAGHNRVDWLDELFKTFPNSWFAPGRFFEGMAVSYLRGKLGFNLSIRNDLNMRFFEIPCFGSCMVTNTDVEGWQELGFVEGEHFIGFEGMEQAKERIAWGLDHPEECAAIAKAGHDFVRAEHTYVLRMKHLLDVCGVKVPESTKE